MKPVRNIMMAVLAAVVLASSAVADGFKYFVDMTVSGYSGSSDLKDFPLLVRVSESRISGFRYSDVSGGAAAVRFYAEDGTLLPSECELWRASGESIFWVKLPVLSGKTTKLRMRWGLLDGEPLPESNPTEVWTGFAGVWHMGEDVSRAEAAAGKIAKDSTANGLDAQPVRGTAGANTNSGTTSSLADMISVDGPIGNARWNDNWSGTADGYNGNRFEVAANPALNTGAYFTFSCWIKFDDYRHYPQIAQHKPKAKSGNGWQIELRNTRTEVSLRGSGDRAPGNVEISSGAIRNYDYQFYTFVYKNDWVYVYVNGEQKGQANINAPGDNNSPFTFGNHADNDKDQGTQSVQGKFDEVRLATSDLSADWIKADYMQADKSQQFISFGEICNGATAYWAVDPSFSQLSWPVGEASGVSRRGRAIVNGEEATVTVVYRNLYTGEETTEIPDTRGLYRAIFTVEGVEELTRSVEIEVYSETAYVLTSSDRVLLFNVDKNADAPVADQQNWSNTDSKKSVFWNRLNDLDNGNATKYPQLQKCNMFEMWTQNYGSKLWTLDYCRQGNTYNSDGSMASGQNYLPVSSTSRRYNSPTLSATTKTSASLAMQNTTNSCIYSSCYDEGIGVIYFDAVNGSATAENRLVVEVCTKVIALEEDSSGRMILSPDGAIADLPPTDENSMYVDENGVTNRFARCVWEPVGGFRYFISDGVIDETLSSAFDGEITLDCTTGGSNQDWFRIRTDILNIRKPVRFRIRRAEAGGNAMESTDSSVLDSGVGANSLALVDNIICSPPAMSVKLGQHGSFAEGEVGAEEQGGVALGQRGACNVAFPAYDETNLYIRATTDYTGLTNSVAEIDVDTDSGGGFISAMTCTWRWRYLDQAASPWTTLFLYRDPEAGPGEWRIENPLPLVDENGESVYGPGDIEYSVMATISAPFYSFVDYTGANAGVGGFTERIGRVDYEPPKDYNILVGRHDPSAPKTTFVRLREGSSRYESMRIVVEDALTGAAKTVPMELVGDHQWRGFLPTTNKVEKTFRFWFEGVHPQEDGALYYDDSPENVDIFRCSASAVDSFPFNGTMEDGEERATLLVAPDMTGYILFSVNDSGRALAITHADRQTFDNWPMSRRNKADRFSQFMTSASVTNAASNAANRYPADKTKSCVQGFALTKSIEDGWREDFKISGSQTTAGYPIGQSFRSTKTPKGTWTAEFGSWASPAYGVTNSTDFAMLMRGESLGSLTFTHSSSTPAPNGLDTFSFAARLAQHDDFDDMSYNMSAYRMANYTLAAQATFDSTSDKLDGFDGEASVSMIAGYVPNKGCYEYRVTAYNLVSGNGETRARLRHAIYRWAYKDGKIEPTALMDTFGEARDGDAAGATAAWRWTVTGLNKEDVCRRIPLGKLGTYLSGMYFSFSNGTDRVYLTAGVSAGSGNKAARDIAFTYDGKDFCQISVADTTPVTRRGSYGFVTKNCPAQICFPRVYENKTVAESDLAATTPEGKGKCWIGSVPLLRESGYTAEQNALFGDDPDWALCQSRLERMQLTGGVWGMQAVAGAGQTIQVQTQAIDRDTGRAIDVEWVTQTNIAVTSFCTAPYSLTLQTPETCNVRVMPGDAAADVVIDSLAMSQWCGATGTDENPKSTAYGNYEDFRYASSWISNRTFVVNSQQVSKRVAVLAPRRAVSATKPVGIRTPRLTGLGSLTFSYVDAYPGATVVVQYWTGSFTSLGARTEDPEDSVNWREAARFTIDPEDIWEGTRSVFLGERAPKQGVFRIVIPQATVREALSKDFAHKDEPNWMGITITDVYCYDEPPFDEKCWWGWNFLTTGWDGDSGKANSLASILDGSRGAVGVLNNNVRDETALATGNSEDYVANNPFIQSPTFPTNFIGDITFRARAYSADRPSCVTVWGAVSGSLQMGSDWLPITNVVVNGTAWRRYTVKCTDEQRFCAIRLGVANVQYLEGDCVMSPAALEPVPETVAKAVIDDVVVSERGLPDIGFRVALPFRTGLADNAPVADIESRDQQPLLNEQFGFQGELVVRGMTDEIDLSITPEVYVSYFPHVEPWGYTKWKDLAKAGDGADMVRLTPVGEGDQLIYRSTADAEGSFVDPLGLEKDSDTCRVVQYYFTIRYWNKGESRSSPGHTKGIDHRDWTMPSWYFGYTNRNEAAGAAFSPFTVLDNVSPGRAWINEVNYSADVNPGLESANQFIEVCFPTVCDMTGWKLIRYDRSGTGRVMAIIGLYGVPSGKDGDPAAPDFAFMSLASSTQSSGLTGENAPDAYWDSNQDTGLMANETYGFRLERPSGIIEQQIVVQGNIGDSRYSIYKIGTNVVASLEGNGLGKWTLACDDTNTVGRSAGVVQNAGELVGDWSNAQAMTPGRLNGTQVIPDNWYLPPSGSNVWLSVGVVGSDIWFLSPSGPVLSSTVVVPMGAKTNLYFRTSPWFAVGSLLRDATNEVVGAVVPAGKDEDKFPLFRYEFMDDKKSTAKLIAKAAVDERVLARGDLDPDDPYTPAIMEWLKRGTANGDFLGGEISTNCFFRGLGANDTAIPLGLKDRYWLDIDPTSDDWDLRGGMGDIVNNSWSVPVPTVPPAKEIVRKASDYTWPMDVTNRLVSVTLMISNKVNNAYSRAPYRLQGLGGERSDEVGAANWTSETFKVEMSLIKPEGADGIDVRDNFYTVRAFVFGRGSFGAPDSAHPYSARVEIIDPNSPSSQAYGLGWWKYPGSDFGYMWKLNSKGNLEPPSVLKEKDTWSGEWE